ncbi:hypothetical protein QTH90_20970 [Variovorax sp. J2P1-59]|uniref:hypothetical protein n=1 Tax=Variovorax flavidus TaxID=3053501 RepID=UPI0025780B86|nr:hypothetical protein [Variovorax sp. J2P1-59]MDM0076894.1 hypothetical protein [Variovorax sp. J2P1-59]
MTIHLDPDPKPALRMPSFHAWRSQAVAARPDGGASRTTSPMGVRALTSPGCVSPGRTAAPRAGAVVAQPVTIWRGARDAAHGADAGARPRHAFPRARVLVTDDVRNSLPPQGIEGRSRPASSGSTRARPAGVAFDGHRTPASTARSALGVALTWRAPEAARPDVRPARPFGSKVAMTARGAVGLAAQARAAGARPSSRSSAPPAELTWRALRRDRPSADDSPASDGWPGEGSAAATPALRTAAPRGDGIGTSGAPAPSPAAPAFPPPGSAAAAAMADRLAQDVMHRLERRLRIERERRGL